MIIDDKDLQSIRFNYFIKLIIISLILVGSKFLSAQSKDNFLPVSSTPLLKAHAHNENRKVRFWATDVDSSSDQIKIWGKLLDAGVDLINTDKLVEFRNFLVKNEDGENSK